MKRGASGLCGLLAIDKPAGISSHDVVNRVRACTGERRVGHAGTLDPQATGLLLVGVGAATRLSAYLTAAEKSYDARIVFGAATDTDDADGRVLCADARAGEGKGRPGGFRAGEGEDSSADRSADARAHGGGGRSGGPDASGGPALAFTVEDIASCDDAFARGQLAALLGEHEQLPPAYSAIKKDGVTAYKAAREGKTIELSCRPVSIYRADLLARGNAPVSLACANGGRLACELPFWDIAFTVSKGTYIRAIARDLGARLGCGAHLGALRRTAVGETGVSAACALEELEERAVCGRLPWLDPAALLGFPVLALDASQRVAVGNGAALPADAAEAAGVRVDEGGLLSAVADGRLLAVYERAGASLRPAAVIPGGVAGVA